MNDLEGTAHPSYRGRAAAVALVRDGPQGIEVYLSRRPKHFRYFPGAFVFPGGRADATDPDLRATAVREVREEIGVEIEVSRLVLLRETYTAAHAGPVYHLFMYAYPVTGEMATTLNPDEVDAEAWVPARLGQRQYDLPYQIGTAVDLIAEYQTVQELIRDLEAV